MIGTLEGPYCGKGQVKDHDGNEYGTYEFLVMPSGLANAPATFCNLTSDVFNEYIDEFVVVYWDDIVLHSKTMADHLNLLRLVLVRLREHSLYVCEKGEV